MKIKFNNTNAQAIPESTFEQSFLQQLRADTAIIAPGARFIKHHQIYIKTKGKAGWDGKVFSVGKDGTFLTGMLPRVVDKSAGKFKVTLEYIGPPRIPGVLKPYLVQLRDYQKLGVASALNNKFNGWWPRGILQVATGGGKTEMAVAMYQSLPLPTLFIVHLKTLLHQTVERFQKYGITTGVVGDSIMNINPNITVATIQSLDYQVKNGNKHLITFLQNVNQVFFDEAHGIAATVAKGNTLVQLSNQMSNAFIRWGLTATPFMRDVYSNNLLEGVTGKVLYKISSEELINQGYLTPPDIRMLKVPPAAGCAAKWPAAYDDGIVLNHARTKMLLDEVAKAPKPALIMCTHIAHAKIIHRNAPAFGIRMGYLDGSSSSTERKTAIQDLVLNKFDAIVCTTIFNAGVDIPQLRTVCLAAGGKSKVALLQKLGRGLRRSVSKDKVTIIDFWDTSAKILEKHSKERAKVWLNEGFTINKV